MIGVAFRVAAAAETIWAIYEATGGSIGDSDETKSLRFRSAMADALSEQTCKHSLSVDELREALAPLYKHLRSIYGDLPSWAPNITPELHSRLIIMGGCEHTFRPPGTTLAPPTSPLKSPTPFRGAVVVGVLAGAAMLAAILWSSR